MYIFRPSDASPLSPVVSSGSAAFRMRSVLVFLFLTLVCALAFDPVFVDELEDLVINKNDERELDLLDDADNMIR